MKRLVTFRTYTKASRVYVGYWSPTIKRGFIYADSAPGKKLAALLIGANRETPAARKRFMSRSLDYKGGEYSDLMLVRLMKTKIKSLGAQLKADYRARLARGYKRIPQNRIYRDLFGDLIGSSKRFRILLEKLEAEQPLSQWPTVKIDECLEQLNPVLEFAQTLQRNRLGVSKLAASRAKS